MEETYKKSKEVSEVNLLKFPFNNVNEFITGFLKNTVAPQEHGKLIVPTEMSSATIPTYTPFKPLLIDVGHERKYVEGYLSEGAVAGAPPFQSVRVLVEEDDGESRLRTYAVQGLGRLEQQHNWYVDSLLEYLVNDSVWPMVLRSNIPGETWNTWTGEQESLFSFLMHDGADIEDNVYLTGLPVNIGTTNALSSFHLNKLPLSWCGVESQNLVFYTVPIHRIFFKLIEERPLIDANNVTKSIMSLDLPGVYKKELFVGHPFDTEDMEPCKAGLFLKPLIHAFVHAHKWVVGNNILNNPDTFKSSWANSRKEILQKEVARQEKVVSAYSSKASILDRKLKGLRKKVLKYSATINALNTGLNEEKLEEEASRISEVVTPLLDSIKISGDYIHGVTKSITMEHDDSGSSWKLGKYGFRLHMTTGSLQFSNFCWDEEVPEFAGAYLHPHILKNGSPCLGSAGTAIYEHLKAGRLALTVRTIIDFLGTYTHNDTYFKMSEVQSYYGDSENEDEDENNEEHVGDCIVCGSSMYAGDGYTSCSECGDLVCSNCGTLDPSLVRTSSAMSGHVDFTNTQHIYCGGDCMLRNILASCEDCGVDLVDQANAGTPDQEAGFTSLLNELEKRFLRASGKLICNECVELECEEDVEE